ncbi:carboxypeptidase regulatory-like domain-containing protein, partial [bacterium]|nr:carboxypeptidase regulatory-like domain-containing protein [bacterium]
MTIIWLEMIKGMLLKDLSLGWMRLSVLLAPMQYIPDFYQGHTQHIKADFDVYGDPAIQYWKDVPRVLDFSFPELIPSDIRMIEVSVTNPVNDEGIIGAQVTLYAPGDMPDPDDEDYADYEEMFMITRQTNTDGIVRFIFDEDHSFENNEVVYVTVTGRDILPLFGEIVIDQPQRIIDLAAYSLAEIEGNENGEINPGEIFSLTLTARNIGAEEINNVSAMVLSRSPWVEIENPDIAFGDIRSGAESESEDRVQIIFSQSVPDGVSRSALRPELSIEFTNGDETWISGISLIPKSPNFIVSSVLEDIIIGVEVEDLNIEIENIGSSDGQPLSAEIISLSGAIDVIENFAVYPEIEAGSTGRIRGELLSVSGISIVSPGSQYEMLLLLSQENGFVDTAYFKLQVGETRENVPFGPDNYGYVCLDDTDEMWEIAPAYDWIEISANEDDRDFDGTRFEFEGRSPHDIGEAICIPLGFTSQLYGVEFDSITVATNGFISIGNQPLATNMQNWPMDRGIGGGSGMIAPFWDNLRMIDESGVFWYLDEEDNRMIIEWYEMRLRGDNNLLNFQVLLYDKEFWGTPTGDPNIQFNYKTVEMRSGIGDWAYTIPYASVGISSPDGNSGINYTFNNQYPVAAAPLQNRRSILFTTILMNFGTAFIHGHVRDASNDSLLSGAAVRTTFGQVGITDENGYYIIEDVFCELLFNLTTFKQGFNDSTLFDFEMGEGDTLEINFALFHPEFEPSIRILNSIIDQGSQSELSFRIENPGNGTLDWTFDPRLPDNADVDPWALRRQYPLADMFDDYRINGVVFFDSLFYISGSNDDSPVIYIMNKAGELIDTLSQPGEDNRGMRDLAYDGELIWGCIGQVIYGITPEGELARSFNGPYNPSRQLTWDTQRECLWVSSTTTNPVAIDRNGNMIDGLEINRNGLRIYGLAYYGDDQDDSQLYIIHREIESYSRTVHKANIESGEMTFVSYLDPEQQDAPTGAFITNTYDPYSWVLLSITDIGNRDIGDQLEIWQIEGRTDWYSLEVESDNGFE